MQDKAQAIIDRGQRAGQLLENPTLNEALDDLLREADQRRENSKPDEIEVREECHRAKKSIEALRKKLSLWASSGIIEQIAVDAENAKRENVNA